MKIFLKPVYIFFVCLFLSFFSKGQDTLSADLFRLYLIGDSGKPSDNDMILNLLKKKLNKAGENSAVVFLGDNIYPDGMPPENHKGRHLAEERLRIQLEIIKNYQGKSFTIPGNHDWKEGNKEGWTYINEQEEFVKQYLKEDVFFPKSGCPGPVEIPLTDKVTLIILDTQWFLHKGDKPGPRSNCKNKDHHAVLSDLENMLKRNQGKKVVIAGHHPLFPKGAHGGYFSLKTHIFPLTDLEPYLYLPLPIVGSLYPLVRVLFPSVQDIAHPRYRQLKADLSEIFEDYPGLIYASGHDHSLQYTLEDSINYIVSGAGSKTAHVKKAKGGDFSIAKKGFGELVFLNEGRVLLNFFEVSSANKDGEVVFSTSLISN